VDELSAKDQRKGMFGDVKAPFVIGNLEHLSLTTDDLQALRDRGGEWQRHIETLPEIDPPASRGLLVHAYLAIKHPLWDVPPEPDGAFFEALVRDLALHWSSDGIPPLLMFVGLLASGTAGGGFRTLPQAIRGSLGQWVERGIEIWRIAPADFGKRQDAAEARAREILAANPALLIAVEPVENRPEVFTVRAWVWLAEQLSERVGKEIEAQYRFEEVPPLLHRLRKEALLYVADDRWKALTVELFLPRAFLSAPVYTWPIQVGLDEDEEVPICLEHRIVVRSSERSLSPKDGAREVRAKWRAKWTRLAGLGQVEDSLVFKPVAADDFSDDKELFRKLRSDEVAIYAETLAPPAGLDHCEKVLKRIINAGLPLGLWLRSGNAFPGMLYGELDAMTQCLDLHSLLEEARKEWLAAEGATGKPPSLGSLLVLLYDDPNRLPFNPDDQLGLAR
jgi:hypothetical protein